MNQDQLDASRRVAYLVTGFIRNDLTETERHELNDWVEASDENQILFGKLTDKNNILEARQWFDELDKELALKKFRQSISERKKFSIRQLHPAWIAAASLVIIIGVMVFRFSASYNGKEHAQIYKDSILQILPGSKRAMLVTGDGKILDLSKPENAMIQINDKSQASNIHSVLSYNLGNASAVTHTLRTPRGGEYQLKLPDGTLVWLNAESSLTYPTAFVKGGRKVQLQGEAYFEVAHVPNSSFEVVCDNTSVKVLGTHFNINAYPSSMKNISLLQGSIVVNNSRQSIKMKAGQQALIRDKGKIDVFENGNIKTTIAWTKGKFSFDETPLQDVMVQLGRWYDVEVEYKGNTEQEFTGDIFRNSSITEVLRMLQLSTGEHFDIHGKLITVRP